MNGRIDIVYLIRTILSQRSNLFSFTLTDFFSTIICTQIREILSLPDLTPEEEVQAREEHKWIFEDGNN
jgi:hypothetical protein